MVRGGIGNSRMLMASDLSDHWPHLATQDEKSLGPQVPASYGCGKEEVLRHSAHWDPCKRKLEGLQLSGLGGSVPM